jgi:hypothetical protein
MRRAFLRLAFGMALALLVGEEKTMSIRLKNIFTRKYWVSLLIAVFAIGVFSWAQESQRTLPESYIALLRSDVQAHKTEILGRKLSLSNDEAKKFWVLQRRYEYDLSKLNDQNLDIMRAYALNWDNLDNEAATGLGKRLLEYQKKRVELREKYFDRFSKELSPTIAAKFFQLEIQLENMVDVGIGSVVPLIKSAD